MCMIQSSLPPAPIMERAGRLIGKLKFSQGVDNASARACGAWTVAAGKKIAEHARATALVRGKLVIEVEDIVWQRQLSTLSRRLLQNLAEALGEPLVTDLDFRPLPRKKAPQRAATHALVPANDPAERIEDPVIALLYQQARRSAQKESARRLRKETA